METLSETLVLNRNTLYIDRNMFQDSVKYVLIFHFTAGYIGRSLPPHQ